MKCQITSVGSGRGFIFVGDDAGRIHFLNRRMEVQTVKMFEGNVEQILQVCIYGESALRGFAFFQKHSSFQKVLILQYFTTFIGASNKPLSMHRQGQCFTGRNRTLLY